MPQILLVDDEMPLLAAMSEYLSARGFTVDCASEMEEAQALLDCREYAVLVCDLALRSFVDAAGFEVISHLRGCSRQTRIVLLTGTRHEDLAERVSELAIDEVLIKPQPLCVVAEVVERLAGEAYADAS